MTSNSALKTVIFAGAIALGLGYGSSAHAATTWAAYCTTIGSLGTSSPDAAVRENLMADFRSNCWGKDRPADAIFDGELNANYYINNGVNPMTPTEVNQVVTDAQADNDVQNSATVVIALSNWRNAAIKLNTDCVANTGDALDAARTDYSTVLSMLGGQTVEAGCGKISVFQSNAQIRVAEAASVCKNLAKQCNDLGSGISFVGPPTPDIQQTRTSAQGICNSIGANASNAQNDVAQKTQQLNATCTAAREEAKKKKDIQATNDEKSNQQNNKLMNQAASALPQLASMLNNQNSNMPVPQVQSAPPMTGQQLRLSNETGPAPQVSKGGGLDGSIGDGMPVIQDDLNFDGDSGHTRKKLGQFGGGGGGGGRAGVSASSPQPAAGRAGGGRGGSRYDTTVNSGFQGGGVMPGFKGATNGGYPEMEYNGGGRRNTRQMPAAIAQDAASMRARLAALRPNWINNRKIAGATGPDGITGPHTDLFRKVRIRYEAVVLDLD